VKTSLSLGGVSCGLMLAQAIAKHSQRPQKIRAMKDAACPEGQGCKSKIFLPNGERSGTTPQEWVPDSPIECHNVCV